MKIHNYIDILYISIYLYILKNTYNTAVNYWLLKSV